LKNQYPKKAKLEINIMIKNKNFISSLNVMPPLTEVGNSGRSLAGISLMKKIPQNIEHVEVIRDIVSRSFRDMER
jgi:hypothetical protein